MKRVIVIGGGGHGRAVAEAIMLSRTYQLIGFLDDAASQSVWDLPVLGPIAALDQYRQNSAVAVVAIGNNAIREEIFGKVRDAGIDLVSVVHPRAIVSAKAVVSRGCAIMAGAIVGPEASLGVGVIVNAGAVVDHHCLVEDFGHIGVGASMAGGSALGKGAWMQAGSALAYGVRIEAGAILGPAEGRVS